ncbi:MAG: Gfo/Idh/MocA family oxidoreductase [Oscillospiraceae bacterium]|nr:Gfo/Idh/MocA family oxidoreductase [Oscillospiraceae bacterium]
MKTVITYGVFDLFHEGHVNLLRRAKALGDKLIVGVTSNEFTRQRGKLLLADSLDTRMSNVRNCPYVDEVILEDHYGQKLEDVQKYGADVFVAGDDWTGKFDFLTPWCEVVYLPRTPGISSSSLRNSRLPEIRFGVIGNGRIAKRFLKEAKTVRGGVRFRYVYNPNYESAKRFAEGYEKLTAVEDLEEFFRSVDAVYIASPHETHYGYAKAALLHGKHTLCEKPLCFSQKEAEELFSLASENEAVLMEAVKTAYCPGFIKMISIARSGFIGDIVDVESCFTRLTEKGVREWEGEYKGSFTEFGSYTLLPVMKLLGTKDLDVRFESVLDEDGADLYTKAYLSVPGKMGLCKAGLGVKSDGHLLISGTKGYIFAPAPWWKTTRFELHYEDPNATETYESEFLGEGLRYELAEFVERIQGWHDSDYLYTKEETVTAAGIFERFLKYRSEQMR